MFSRPSFLPLVAVLFGALLTVGSPAPPSSGTLLVANKGEHTLGLIDPSAAKQTVTIDESGITGHEVVASPDGARAFVPIYGSSGVGLPGTNGSEIDVIDVATRKRIGAIDFGHGVRPHCPIFGPKDGMLYVTAELDHAVAVIDPQTLKIIAKIPTGQAESHMLAISPDGTRGYTANVGPGSVSVLDLAARKTITVIPVAKHIQRISISPDGRWVFTSDTESPRLAVIDTAANKVSRWIPLPSAGYGSASTPDGKALLIALPAANGAAVIDLSSMTVVRTISVAAAPQEVVIRPDAKFAYVSCSAANSVAAIDLSNFSVTEIPAGKGADGLSWAR